MNIKDAVVAALKEMVLPELAVMKQEQSEIKTTLVLTNKRLDDINLHLVDQSRRIDTLRQELNARIDDTNKRIDDTTSAWTASTKSSSGGKSTRSWTTGCSSWSGMSRKSNGVWRLKNISLHPAKDF